MKKLLIVDDEREFVALIEDELKEAGFAVISALDGKRAIHLAKKENPDAILLDIMLPDVNGVNIEKALKEDPDTRDIPIVFISGLYTENDIKKKGHVLEGKKFFAKPFKIEDLVSMINTLT